MARRRASYGAMLAAAGLAGCGGGGHRTDVCSNADGALSRAAFVFVQTPVSGERVSSGFRVSGCSSTFEGNVVWLLRGRSGRVLAHGHTQGGSAQPGAFAFTVAYSVTAQQVGQVTVSEPVVTSEGYPPVRDVLPLVLGA